ERPNIKLSKAARVAQWTLLRFDTVSSIYTTVAVAKAKHWETLEAEIGAADRPEGREKAVIVAACEQAEEHDFLWELVLGMSRHERRAGRDEADIRELLAEFAPSGEMQLMTDRAKGLHDPAIFESLIVARNASACVYQGPKVIGTAFLVARDLV